MSQEQVKLFGFWASQFSKRIELALKLKGIPYEYIEEDITNKSELLLKYNPIHKRVPVFVHNGKAIAESQIILQYIDETWKHEPMILPQDPYDKAMALFWANFLDDKFLQPLRIILRTTGENRENAVEEARGLLQILENELNDKKKKFFGGDQIGYVDIVGDFLGYWFGLHQDVCKVEMLTKEKFPLLFQWTQEFVNHNVVKEILPPKDKLVAYYQVRYGGK
jgi:glutathione S-transferase